MKPQTFLQRLETFGYYSMPRPHADSPGYSGLLAILRQLPNGHEPEMIQLRLHDWDGKSPLKSFHADSNQTLPAIVCPGRIVIRSRHEREATFYSFGGTLESESLSEETVYSLRSTAPVLELRAERETLADLLADETEVLFARAEASLQISSQDLLNLLAKAGAEAVYLSVLQSLLLQNDETNGPPNYHIDFINLLQQERGWYRQIGRWPLLPIDLEALLKKAAAQYDQF